ncbi:MAG: phosphatidylserine decarboxylase [Treponema sp.]|jgi:phosphatidylserine decarboxylase|nr:phosphatidylserine decarboxylase [Treponema sp.]
MRIPVTRYGLPQVLIYPAFVLAVMAALFVFLSVDVLLITVEAVLFLVFVWMLMFFRDPPRKIPLDSRVLLSPADGTITDISEAEIPELGGKALRIGMFLSIFNVHINRAPCAARVESVNYKKGKFKNAMDAEAGRVNESNDILLTRLDEPRGRLLVRQISGAIARRIVCEAKPGTQYAQGETFGMIKFGSRTELYLPLDGNAAAYTIAVKIGDKVNAGLSPLVVYK